MVDIVHPVPAEEIPAWMVPLATGLLVAQSGRRFADWTEKRVAGCGRSWGARDAGHWVATLATEARRLTVPAGPSGTNDLEVDALTAVSVAASHRRRGLLTALLGRSLRAAVERGDAVSMLIAAEWPIYGRFGYAPATALVEYHLRPRRPHPLLPPVPPGRTRAAGAAEIASVAPGLFDRARRLRAGQVDRPGDWWPRLIGPTDAPTDDLWVVHEDDGGAVDGLLRWKVTRDFDLADNLGAVRVDNFVAATESAYRDLWAHLCGIDAVEDIALPDRPADEPIRWALHDGRALRTVTHTDELWLRLLDVPAALSARGYAVPGSVVLDVVDATPGGFAAGRVRLDAAADGAACSPTSDPADLRLDQRALAAIYLGGHRLAAAATGLPVEELRPGAAALVDAMFATPLAPWTQTGF